MQGPPEYDDRACEANLTLTNPNEIAPCCPCHKVSPGKTRTAERETQNSVNILGYFSKNAAAEGG